MPGPAVALVVSAAGRVAVVACLGVPDEGSGLVAVCHRCSRAASQETVAAAAGAGETRWQVVGSVAAGSDQEAAHTAVVVHLGEAGSAVAVVEQRETREAVGMIDRLAEAQSTAVGLAGGLSCVSVMFGSCQHGAGVPYPPFSGGAATCQLIPTQVLYAVLTRVKVPSWWWTSKS
jgi:hypothetical protein